MSSRDGFARADVDTNLLHDRKVLALARQLHDPVRTACALMLWEAALLASWNEGQRIPLADAAPAWWTDDPDEYEVDLQAAGLLDADGRIPDHAFSAWIGAALERRTIAERKGAIGGLMSHGMTYDQSVEELKRRALQGHPQGSLDAPSRNGQPIRPTGRPAAQPAGQVGPSNGAFFEAPSTPPTDETTTPSWEEELGVPTGTVTADPEWQRAKREGDIPKLRKLEDRLIAEYRAGTAS
jgi:hypothetical protein